ncbi:carbamoyl-phosphate synthase small subunit [Scopulibacillus darangshiensis]|uniref:Carbamoyl phosphate synthase small chain n=1 Tax=Scopulibacillus darangshiensis TaxID=442528 RepID=A0A4R2P1Z0_9BACL|nr:carbamoyl phosphate synthase small subunit [Scopulibacillus darangshiensis]TCP28723.1 carbamoyl-phosphate synthase small subunit [Scopulibacillus darangshiensis]
MEKGYLVLETGDIFEGMLIGKKTISAGEVVFNTSMTGYQEILTDPSYAGQMITFCYPLIGNYGINHFDDESSKLHLSGAIISDLCLSPSHFQSVKTFAEHLEEAGIPCIAGVDTRAIVKKIRKYGTMKGLITTSPDQGLVKSFVHDPIFKTSMIDKVSVKNIKQYAGDGPHIALVDYGYKKSMLQALLNERCKVTVIPYSTTFTELSSLKPDGVMFSNGPGDPMALQALFPEVKKITEHFPTLGICLGHQMIALAYGATTEKLLFGHRGANHPVKEMLTGKVWMTSQNHSYVVTHNSINTDIFAVTYQNVNDRTIEGLKHKSLPIETVQFHPEAHPGPDDTHYIFETFIQTLRNAGDITYAATR